MIISAESEGPDQTERMRSLIHYENTHIQIYWKFYHQKMKIFS